MFVKICGLTNVDDALAAVDAGAQAVGFNFVRSSPRFIRATDLSAWIGRIPRHVWKVGVFADEDPAAVAALSASLDFQVAQLHGSETPAELPPGLRVWKAARVTAGFDPASLDQFDVEALLLDGPASGVPFDWTISAPRGRKLILAGGLEPGNVRDAVTRLRPWGVDVCSRIESAPGRKDHSLMRRFIETVLSC